MVPEIKASSRSNAPASLARGRGYLRSIGRFD
jgi:hypothetical protein